MCDEIVAWGCTILLDWFYNGVHKRERDDRMRLQTDGSDRALEANNITFKLLSIVVLPRFCLTELVRCVTSHAM